MIMRKLSDLVSSDLILATIQKLSDKYAELENVADSQLSTEYSKGWYAEYHAAKNKQQVLNELYRKIQHAIEKERELIPQRKECRRKRYYVLKYHDDIVAIINPNTVSSIDVSGSQEGCINVACRVYYKEYGEITDCSIAFYGWYVKLCDVDIETITNTMPNTIVWDENPVVDTWQQADNICDKVRNYWFNIKNKY